MGDGYDSDLIISASNEIFRHNSSISDHDHRCWVTSKGNQDLVNIQWLRWEGMAAFVGENYLHSIVIWII